MLSFDRPSAPGVIRRLTGMCYEFLIILALLAVTLLLPHLLIGAFTHYLATPFFLWVHLFLVLLFYFVWFWSNGRQTLAMKTWRIRITTTSGQPVKPPQALLRYLLCWPSLLAGGIGIVWAAIDRDRQFLHDRLAGTRLVEQQLPK